MNALAVTALVSWLIAEAFGAFMLRSWLTGSRAQGRDGAGVPRRVYGHAVLACSGLLGWIGFVLTSSVGLAWLAIGLLALTVGLGISTLTLWTPYSARRSRAGGCQPGYPATLGITSDEMLARALEDETLTTKLVDDLLATVLATTEPASPRPAHQPTLLAHAVHGALAVSTMLFALLAVVSVS